MIQQYYNRSNNFDHTVNVDHRSYNFDHTLILDHRSWNDNRKYFSLICHCNFYAIDWFFFHIYVILGEYIQLPLQLEEILQDVLQLADLSADNDQVVSLLIVI